MHQLLIVYNVYIIQAFWDMLEPKVQEFSTGSVKDPVSALAILYIIQNFDLKIKVNQCMPLFKALVQENMDFQEIIGSFGET